mmetsp:Transcript_69826/g.164265  ORF Transcript_69826/g.164265 Transcript_69826/m.164265 type:complete len:307 (-) Transcript_69826:629-1549(-)
MRFGETRQLDHFPDRVGDRRLNRPRCSVTEILHDAETCGAGRNKSRQMYQAWQLCLVSHDGLEHSVLLGALLQRAPGALHSWCHVALSIGHASDTQLLHQLCGAGVVRGGVERCGNCVGGDCCGRNLSRCCRFLSRRGRLHLQPSNFDFGAVLGFLQGANTGRLSGDVVFQFDNSTRRSIRLMLCGRGVVGRLSVLVVSVYCTFLLVSLMVEGGENAAGTVTKPHCLGSSGFSCVEDRGRRVGRWRGSHRTLPSFELDLVGSVCNSVVGLCVAGCVGRCGLNVSVRSLTLHLHPGTHAFCPNPPCW